MKAKLSHIALLITDIDKARAFYGNILGLKEIARPPFFIKGLWYDLGEFQLHLMLYEEFLGPQVHPWRETVQPHFALSMTALESVIVLENLKKAGIAFIEEYSDSPL